MEKHKIIVPPKIRYIGEVNKETGERIWKDYELGESPYDKPHILNKKLTGCGFTEYCLKNKQKLILVSPRKFLLENKEDQHEGEVYYVKNELETSVDFELDISQDDKSFIEEKSKETKSSENNTVENLDLLKKNLRNAMRAWEETHDEDEPFKILVTYDSFRHVKDALKHFYWNEGNHLGGFDDRFNEFQVVVDEFQSILIDSRFKSDTEIELLDNLKDVEKVCYVSATPMLDKYLERLDNFKDLPYYELDWETEDPGRIKKPKLEIRFVTSSLNQAVNGIIQGYKDGRFDTRIDSKTGKFIESREAVLFLNSVAGICQAIRSNKLHLEQVNVICAQSTKNNDSLRKAFNDVLIKEAKESGTTAITWKKKDRIIGTIPIKGEPHKMFTFCTRTVYLGADFYSTNAKTFIFSDSNISCLAVDISMDLEQIIGRQRLDENPWKNSALMYVKCTNLSNKTSQEEFNEFIENKLKKSSNLLSGYYKCNDDEKWDIAEAYQKLAKMCHYRDDYVAVTRIINQKTGQVVKLQPVFNELVLITEERAFELQQSDYADRFSVFNSTQSIKFDSIENEVEQRVDEFNGIKRVNDRIKFMMSYSESTTKENLNNFLELIPGKYKDYYTIVGPDIIKAFGCEESKIKKAWMERVSNSEINDEVTEKICCTFIVGQKYSNKNTKDILNTIYKELGYSKTAKATDLELYYVTKAIKLQDPTGKWVHGFEIIGKK